MSDHNSIDATVSNQDQYHNYPKITPPSYVTKRAMSLNQFKDRASKIHDNKYDYSLAKFSMLTDRITIVCPIHGKFTKMVNQHLNGGGCQKCADMYRGYKQSSFVEFCKNNMAELYVIMCSAKGEFAYNREIFYKIGITTKTVQERYSGIKSMPYDFEVLYRIKHEPEYIYDLEKILFKMLAKYKHKPKLAFGGDTECFSTIIPILYVLENVNIS